MAGTLNGGGGGIILLLLMLFIVSLYMAIVYGMYTWRKESLY